MGIGVGRVKRVVVSIIAVLHSLQMEQVKKKKEKAYKFRRSSLFIFILSVPFIMTNCQLGISNSLHGWDSKTMIVRISLDDMLLVFISTDATSLQEGSAALGFF